MTALAGFVRLIQKRRVKKIFEVMDILEEQRQKQGEKKKLLASNSNTLSIPSSNIVLNTSIFFWDQAQLKKGKERV